MGSSRFDFEWITSMGSNEDHHSRKKTLVCSKRNQRQTQSNERYVTTTTKAIEEEIRPVSYVTLKSQNRQKSQAEVTLEVHNDASIALRNHLLQENEPLNLFSKTRHHDVLGHIFYSIIFCYWMLLFGFHRLAYGDSIGAKTNFKEPRVGEQFKCFQLQVVK